MPRKYKQCGIYCYHNIINGKNYIGQSIDLQHRKSQFGNKKRAYSGRIFQNAIKKYGKENFQYSVLTHCKPEELNYYEQFYISRLKTTDRKHGYNSTSGGDSQFFRTEDCKENMRASWTEERREEESKRYKGEKNPNYGRRWNNELKLHVSKIVKDRARKLFIEKHGISYKEMVIKVSEYLKENKTDGYSDVSKHFSLSTLYTRRICHELGYTSDKAFSNLHDKQRKPVVQCDRTNHDIVLNVFRSLSEAEQITGIRSIGNCVGGKQCSSGGYYWRYSDGEIFTGNYNTTYLCPTNDRRKLTDDMKQKIRETGLYKRENLYKKVFCYNGTGNLIKVYDSVSSVTVDGFDPCQVSHCCNPKQIDRTHKGYVFSYKELSQKQVLDLFAKHVKKPVVQLTLDGHFIKEWESATLAGKELGLGNTNISSCCRHKTNKHGNFKWLFKEEYDSLSQNGKVAITEPKPPNSKTVNLVDENGDVIKTYVSRRAAAKELNIKEGSVYLYVNKKKLIMGKYYLVS